MGGQAFAKSPGGPINVPRMPTEVYQRVAGDAGSKLQTLFKRVTVPREAPGKLDHGDVDFLVEGIRAADDADIWGVVKDVLGAEHHISRGDSHSFAVQHPDLIQAYVQIDVELSPGNDTSDGAELFEWTKFMKSDSDLLQIIGVCHRPLGITCNDRGMHIRVEEIEPYNKKKALLFLTRDSDEAMEFYGLDASRYRAGFECEVDLFEWVSTGRFFASDVFESRVEKSNDRSRQSKRAMYRRFVEEYMPAYPKASESKPWTRQQVVDEALSMFGKQKQYEQMLAENHVKEAEEELWKKIRTAIPTEGSSLSLALKSLRRWVDFDENGQPYITEEMLDEVPIWTANVPPASLQDALDWVEQNWQEAKALEKKRAKGAKETATGSTSYDSSAKHP